MSPRVLVVDDELQILRGLKVILRQAGYDVEVAATKAEAIDAAAARPPDAMVLDLVLPDGSGVDVAREVRKWSRVPIIVLSARGQERDKVAALDAGADDYVGKPFAVGELQARLRVALRHAAAGDSGEPTFTVGDLRIDQVRRQILLGGKEIHLTPIEYRLLTTLARHAGRVMSQRQLLKDVWGPAQTEEAHYLRVYMGTLRRKLERDPARPRYLLTEPGVGYRLAAE
jgi:two-component system, OmpR family, KDP operon response regulator KdpE